MILKKTSETNASETCVDLVFPKVAVLVLNYNGKQHLHECFSSLRTQTYPNFEVFLLDNCSRDNSVEFVKDNFPWVKLVRFEKNFGFAGAYNRALSDLSVDFVVFLNNDVRVEPNWLSELMSGISGDASVAIAGSRVCVYGHPDVLQFDGGKISPIGSGFELGRFDSVCNGNSVNKYVGYVSGGSMVVRKSFFLGIGGFDEDYFAYDEDSDVCLRTWLYGHKVLYVPSSVVYHKIGSSFKRFKATREFLSEKNRFQSMIKNFQTKNLIKGLSLSAAYIPYQVIRFLRVRKPVYLLSLFRAYYWLLKNFPNLVKKRYHIQARRKIGDPLLIEQGILATVRDALLALFNYRKTVLS